MQFFTHETLTGSVALKTTRELRIKDLLFHREGADVDHVCVRIVLQIANPHLRESVARIRQLKRLPDAHFLQRIVADGECQVSFRRFCS